jgi:hypothetical protein
MMPTFLKDEVLWPEIRKRAKASKSLTVVSAYLGTHPDKLLKWPHRAIVVSDLSEGTVRRGVCSAKGALRLRKKKKATILQCRDLHAKIYLFDKAAVVASANLSAESSDKLLEAGVLFTGSEVAPVRNEVQRLVRRSVLLEDAVIENWSKIEPRRKAPKGRKVPRAQVTVSDLLSDGRTVWLVDCYPYEDAPGEAKAKARKEKGLSAEHDINAARIEWFSACGKKIFANVRAGDWVVLWWLEGTRAEHGKLEGPFECLAPVDLGSGLRGARYALALVPRHRRAVGLDEKHASKMMKSMSTRKINQNLRILPPKTVSAVAALLR